MTYQRALVVEDNEDVREMVCGVLSAAGYRTNAARHGLDAWELLERIAPPHVLVVDLMMPVLDGWRFVELLRSHEGTRHLPIVAMSAFRLNAESRGQIDAFVPKPFDPDVLVGAVAQALAARPPRIG